MLYELAGLLFSSWSFESTNSSILQNERPRRGTAWEKSTLAEIPCGYEVKNTVNSDTEQKCALYSVQCTVTVYSIHNTVYSETCTGNREQ